VSKHAKASPHAGSVIGYAMLAAGLLVAVVEGCQSAAHTHSTAPAWIDDPIAGSDADLLPQGADRAYPRPLQAGADAIPTAVPAPAPTRGPAKPGIGRQLVNTLPGGKHVPSNLLPFMEYMRSISDPATPVHVHIRRGRHGVTVTASAVTRSGVRLRAAVALREGKPANVAVTATAPDGAVSAATHTVPTPDALTAVAILAVTDAVSDVSTPAPTPAPTPSDTPTPDPTQDVMDVAPAVPDPGASDAPTG
jgi:hypothetical protein